MAYTTINKSTDYFNTKTYSGTGSSQSITGIGFEPSFTWIKHREDISNQMLTDSVRAATKTLHSQNTDTESTDAQALKSFDSDGFTVGTDTDVNGTGAAGIVAWNWKAGTTSGLSGGTITPSSYSINVQSGFGIYKYVGNGNSVATISHGLNSIPKMIIIKRLDTADQWCVYHYDVGNTRRLRLNSNDYYGTGSGYWYNTSPTSSVFTIGNSSEVNSSGGSYIAYCFCEKVGYSKVASYRGDGQTTPRFIYTGMKPAFLLIKRYDSSGDWQLVDNKRDIDNPTNKTLFPNLSNAEDSGDRCDLLSNGFAIRSNTGTWNASSSATYIYMAFAEAPLVGSNNIPCTAR